jgi:hypothetical protein
MFITQALESTLATSAAQHKHVNYTEQQNKRGYLIKTSGISDTEDSFVHDQILKQG